MALVILNYQHLDSSTPKEAHFLWFVSAAPDNTLRQLGVQNSPSVARIVLDITMVLSENAGLGGRIGLHAAPAGGAWLADFYRKTCQLIQLPAASALPAAIKRKNDGRFFYADEKRAGVLLNWGDTWR